MSNVGGRPTVIDESTVRKLEQAFRDGLSVSEGCFVSGIGRTAYYSRIGTDEAFANKMERAKQYVNIKAKKTVAQAISDGNINAAKWWLERKARNEFGQHPVDEDADWSNQAEANVQDSKLLLILEGMSAVAKGAIQSSARPQHTALKVIATELTALEPDDVPVADIADTTEARLIEPATVQASTSPDDIFADLLYDD